MTLKILPKFSSFEHFVDGQMFLCNKSTQQECLDSCLFGSPKNMWPEVQQITKNTAIFLYTVGEQPTLHGIFTAVGEPVLNMETKAFGGRFPSQVQVKLYYNFPTLPGGNLRKMLKGDRNRQRRLTRRQTHEILASMISYTYNRREAGHLETLSKQRKKLPADPPMQLPAMSSGIPIYIYNPKNTRVSLAKSTIELPNNSNGFDLTTIPTLAFKPLAKEEYQPTLPLPAGKIPPFKLGFMPRVEQRKVLAAQFSIAQEQSLPQYLYFPILSLAQQPINKLVPQKNSTKLATKLYVGNLHNTITKNDLRMSFSNFGKILESGIQKNADGHSIGSGWVEFENASEAAWAIERVNGMLIANLPVIVCPWSDVLG